MQESFEELGGYLFRNGERIDFEEIISKKINFHRETGALRIRVTKNEVNVDFLEEFEPTKEQIQKIQKFKRNSKKLFFEILDKEGYPIAGYGGFDKTISEMRAQLNEFYNSQNI